VKVVEHKADYSSAVKAGREMAASKPYIYFIDDENSPRLFLGYSVAALRLQKQLADRHIPVDNKHPLFVYIPCGVGGAPAGITFGLKHVFGDNAHCFFAEPVESPCMLLGLITSFKEKVSVYDIGLTNTTAADGLAVGTASALAGTMIQSLVSGSYTVRDEDLFRWVYDLFSCENIKIEPSAAAGCQGPLFLCKEKDASVYLKKHGLDAVIKQAQHIIWTTGGSLVPEEEFEKFIQAGRH